MSQDFFRIIKDIQPEDIEMKLALECAPLLLGLRFSNLININKNQFQKIKILLKDMDISYYILLDGSQKFTMLLYRYDSLALYLSQQRQRSILNKIGYHAADIYQMLYLFSLRYKRFMHGNGEFPHEMGIFLGYPIEDVIGFIENDGRNFLCTGYWKVYADLQEKIKMFESFEKAKEMMVVLISDGFHIIEVVDLFYRNASLTIEE